METNYAQVPFERYADDVIVHCRTEREAKEVRTAIAERLRDCGLELHPEKTKIVYCKDELRKGKHTNEKFDFLGYEFRPLDRELVLWAILQKTPFLSTKTSSSDPALIARSSFIREQAPAPQRGLRRSH